MAVLDSNEALVGILDESDVLLALGRDPHASSDLVGAHMTSRVETIHPSKSSDDLMPIFRADRVAVVHDGKVFTG